MDIGSSSSDIGTRMSCILWSAIEVCDPNLVDTFIKVDPIVLIYYDVIRTIEVTLKC